MSVRSLRRGSAAASRVQAPAGTTVVDLPGSNGEYISTPDSAANSIASDIDVLAKVAVVDWANAPTSVFVSKMGANGNRGFSFRKNSFASTLQLGISPDGSTFIIATSSAATGFVAGTVHWVRATWNNATNVVQFFTSDDTTNDPAAVNWTQLGTNQSINATGIFNSSAAVEVGHSVGGTSGGLDGQIYVAQLRDGIGGTPVNTFDATVVSPVGVRDPSSVAAGGPWTLNGSFWSWMTV